MSPTWNGVAPRRSANRGSTGKSTLKPMKSMRIVVKTTPRVVRPSAVASLRTDGSVSAILPRTLHALAAHGSRMRLILQS
jgi:hypothetical protein